MAQYELGGFWNGVIHMSCWISLPDLDPHGALKVFKSQIPRGLSQLLPTEERAECNFLLFLLLFLFLSL